MDHHQETDNFLDVLAQTNTSPFLIEIDRAEGCYIWDKNGKQYLDMIAGVAVNNIGHGHPKVIQAIKEQVDKHLHVMVYGEFVQDNQTKFAQTLTSLLPKSLNSVYCVNSGTEANEAALKLAKRYTGRSEIISFKGAYHGSTHGSLSVSGNETKKGPFRPLLPNINFIEFNETADLDQITDNTAAVIMETIQGDAGVRIPAETYIKALRHKCSETGALLILDEIQCGIGRTGKLFAFEHFGITPDILTTGKALGGGMPIGALVANKKIMSAFSHDPMLGHITTFGGHPVVCAAGNACLEVLQEEDWIGTADVKGKLLQSLLESSEAVTEVRRIGLMLAIDMKSEEQVSNTVYKCLENGLISFWFLSHPNSFRLSPPLSITNEQIQDAATIILAAIKETSK